MTYPYLLCSELLISATLIRFDSLPIRIYVTVTDNYAFLVAEAQVTTQPNRYLMIATSGGLNQQRTGVSFYASIFIVKQVFDIWLLFSFQNLFLFILS